VVAVASDQAFRGLNIPVVDLNDLPAIADLVCTRAQPLAAVLEILEGPGP
jgi:molybdopterin-guanine dinucleotide biosynthesis protein B